MQLLLLALSIILLTIIAGHKRVVPEAGNTKVLIKRYKQTEKKTTLTLPGDRLSVYSSRFDWFIN
ncbi:hypothetical protein [Longitalea luteola]|uniref:hypothetical protein n=1 Tax=Longitalea luteola TaxID=2812563 RepID=UPI001A9767C9|nr:hypothetical protein [Longitalea luteola]